MKGLIEKIKAESAAVVNPCLRVKAMSFNHHQRLRLTLTDGDATIACNVAQKLNVTLRGLGIGGVVRLTNYLLNTIKGCLLYTSPSPRDKRQSRMPSSA